jgi:hypothetical protein
VKSGDTFASIAAAHRVDEGDLRLANANVIQLTAWVGMLLSVPCEPLKEAKAITPVALKMVEASIAALTKKAAGTVTPREESIVQRHWHLLKDPAKVSDNAKAIAANYGLIKTALTTPTMFREVSNDTADADQAGTGIKMSTHLLAAYTFASRTVSFTSHYFSLGPHALAAVMIHELAHYIGKGIGHGAGEKGPAYDKEAPADAVKNAHCYANFAAHIGPKNAFDPQRPWGLGRPTD